jgi:hypothetical protein
MSTHYCEYGECGRPAPFKVKTGGPIFGRKEIWVCADHYDLIEHVKEEFIRPVMTPGGKLVKSFTVTIP